MNAKKFSLVYLLLALVVFASSVAWTPGPLGQAAAQKNPDDPTPSPNFWKKWPPQYTRGRISARIVGDEVVLYGENLPRRHDFFVKVRRNVNGVWERLGVSYSDNSGYLEDSYRLPQKLRKLAAVNVCLKDVITNRAYCITARR